MATVTECDLCRNIVHKNAVTFKVVGPTDLHWDLCPKCWEDLAGYLRKKIRIARGEPRDVEKD